MLHATPTGSLLSHEVNSVETAVFAYLSEYSYFLLCSIVSISALIYIKYFVIYIRVFYMETIMSVNISKFVYGNGNILCYVNTNYIISSLLHIISFGCFRW